MKLSIKITALVIFVVILFAASSVGINQYFMQNYLSDSQAEWVKTLTHTIAEGVSLDAINGNTLRAREQLQSIVQLDEALEYAYITGFDGKIFTHTFDKGFPRALMQHVEEGHGEKYSSYRFSTPEGDFEDIALPLIEGMRAQLHVGINQYEITSLIGKIKADIFWMSLWIGLLGITLAFLIGRRISAPLANLSEWMNAYGKGERQGEFVSKSTTPEILDLAESFNSMIAGRTSLEAELNESEAFNRMLVDSSPLGFALTRMDGSLVDVNSAYASILGRTEDELEQLNCRDITPEEYTGDEDSQLQTLESTGLYGPYEKEYIHADGHRIPVRLHGRLVTRNGEKFIWSSVEDITIHRHAEQALQHTNAELEKRVESRTEQFQKAKTEAEQANRAKSEFLSSMSHELRTPLNAVLGFSQLLAMDLEDTIQKDNINEVYKAGLHLLALINQVLDLTRIETGQFEISIEDVELRDVLDECLAMISPQAELNNVRLTDNIDTDKKYLIAADYTRLKQVILNLLSNAVKYNNKGGSVTINCKKTEAGQLRISVIDTGPGLNETQQRLVFVPFERIGQEASGIEGSGIGLVITRHLIELMGGTIGFESTPGKGSIFWVDVNISNTDTQYSMAPTDEVPVTKMPESEDLSSATILYVEDNVANLKVVESIIDRQTSSSLISATDAPMGIDLALKHHPDLILMDINLPGMDGYEALEKLKAMEATADIPVIAVSANAMQRDIDRGMAAGFDRYLTKPFDIKEFLEVVNMASDKSSFSVAKKA